MGKLIYLMNVSLDGFIESSDHGHDWTTVDDELHAWFNDQTRDLAATLYGRRLYEVMSAHWPTGEADPESTEVTREYARIWNRMPKIVFSTTLESVDFDCRLVRGDVSEEYAKLRAEFDGDIGVAGPTLASEFIKRGLVDEYRLVIHPVILGAGTPYLPPLDRPIKLRLTETRVFGSGVVYQGYAVVRD